MEIPDEIKSIVENLEKHGKEAFVVGGCVRDLLRGAEPNDWDIATNARPEEIQKIFSRSFCNNNFGTVVVQNETENEKLKEVEITPYRIDEKYTDKRHPDKVIWAKTIKQDLARRDFTINAIALAFETRNIKHETKKITKKSFKFQDSGFKIIDPFDGQKDLEAKIIRAVGKPDERFSEDALRLMRAVRFSVTLGEKLWKIEDKTYKSIEKNSNFLAFISKERVRDELEKIIMSRNAAKGIEILRRLGLLKHIVPELETGFGVGQNKHHIYQIYQHNLLSLDFACKNNFSRYVRFASLLHDVGKTATKRGEGLNSTFYNHEIVGAKMAFQILNRLRFSKKDIEKITRLVRFHLFYYNVGEVGESSVRRLLRRVGQEDIDELILVRQSDRIGSAVPKAEPYKLRHLKYMFEKVSKDPISVKMLKIDGNEVMKLLDIKPGQKIGQILTCLLGEVLKNPEKNNRTFLEKEVKRLGQEISEAELIRTFNRTREEIDKVETKEDKMTKEKYWVS